MAVGAADCLIIEIYRFEARVRAAERRPLRYRKSVAYLKVAPRKAAFPSARTATGV